MSDLVKELREQFDQYGIVDFEANDIAYLFQRIAELEAEATSLNSCIQVRRKQVVQLKAKIAELEAAILKNCDITVKPWRDLIDPSKALGEAK